MADPRHLTVAALCAVAVPARAQDFSAGFSRWPIADTSEKLFALINLPHLHPDERLLFLLALGCYSALFGYLADLALSARGFGVVGNGLLTTLGVCAALRAGLPWVQAHAAGLSGFNAALLLASSGAPIALIAAALFKSALGWLHGHGASVLGARRGKDAAPPLDPKIVSLLRRKD